jgi:hypothetical protein
MGPQPPLSASTRLAACLTLVMLKVISDCHPSEGEYMDYRYLGSIFRGPLTWVTIGYTSRSNRWTDLQLFFGKHYPGKQLQVKTEPRWCRHDACGNIAHL